ncbi:uncharacterized protein LOC107796269 [Nicotiana tabacum]|uniref:Transmembrane protein 209 n=1 Tax=Nicotiana tabacum TaxID=4097 RepID=A0A1S4ACX4_TOBAC|nr:transmembrane protein 209 [Nicotiana tomentosiformis]XP_016474507.1 PREDICTED: transmembrane protein 209-like [Nicotiana tabacum]
MSAGGGGVVKEQSSTPPKPSKFTVYQNPAFSAALTTNSLRPSKSTFLFILSISFASASALLSIFIRESGIVDSLRFKYVSQETACLFARLIQAFAAIVLVGTFLALVKAIYLCTTRTTDVTIMSPTKGTKEHTHLTNRQLGLLGIKPKVEQTTLESSKRPPKSRSISASPSDVLVPLHQPIPSSNHSSRLSGDKARTGSGTKVPSFSNPSKSPASPSLYLVPASSSLSPSIQSSPGGEHLVATPWSNKRATFHKEIATEEQLEKFLADVDERITESGSKLATPPPTISGFGVASPGNLPSSTNTSGTPRRTPLRPVRMSPGSQKFTTPPKKGEGDLPPPMSMEESTEAFEHLGIYPQIEQWRDRLRQWFSSMLLKPMLIKIDTSHTKVMQAAAKLGITITISQVGNEAPDTGTAAISATERTNEWKPSFSVDEDGLLHQLRATLVQALDSCMPKTTSGVLQLSSPQNSQIPILQECIDAITEHQRLLSLMKGEWAKGLLPQSGVRAENTVQRIRELAEGTCLRNYDYLGSVEGYGKGNKKWSSEFPTDSHLLLYLFCTFLEHPKWMLHVDPTAYVGAQYSKNPLFLGVLPPKERFPEKYVAVLSGVPSVLHPGACILAVGKQSPPVFALYWDKNPQFSLQGRTALWDSILLLCYKIKIGYGGFVRGMHLSSSALGILPVLDPEKDDC